MTMKLPRTATKAANNASAQNCLVIAKNGTESRADFHRKLLTLGG